MTLRKLAKLLCEREGLKKQVTIADMYEILVHLSDVVYEDPTVCDFLLNYGKKRYTKKHGG